VPSAYLFVAIEPSASRTSCETKFSDGIISRTDCWRSFSASRASAIFLSASNIDIIHFGYLGVS